MFFERPLEGIINNYRLHVVADCMIASYNAGGEPEKPFFFLQVRNAARFKQKQFWGKTDGSGRPHARSDANRHAIGSQRRTAKIKMLMAITYMAVL